jgi:hypothetical protein
VFDVADAITDESERQLYTFTNKFGTSKFVAVNNRHQAKLPIKTYLKKPESCIEKDQTKPKTNNSTTTTITTPQIQEFTLHQHEIATTKDTTHLKSHNDTILILQSHEDTPLHQDNTLNLQSHEDNNLPQQSHDDAALLQCQSLLNDIQLPGYQVIVDDVSPLACTSDEFVVDFTDTEVAFCFTDTDVAMDITDSEVAGIEHQIQLHVQDDGYSTAGSNSGKSSPTNSVEGDLVTLYTMEPPIQMETTTEVDFQEINLNLNGEVIEFNLFDDDNILEKNPDPYWGGQEGVSLLGTFENLPDLLNAFTAKKPATTKVTKRHTKGPIQQPLEQLPEENRKNVVRCREYRKTKSTKTATEMEELEVLDARNKELQEKEQMMKDKLVKMQGAYLKLISEGRIKFN